MSVMASAKARLSSFEYVPSVHNTFHSGMFPPNLCADRFADGFRAAECLPVRRRPQVLDEPVPSGGSGLLEKRCVSVEMTAVKGDQLLGFRGGFVHLALNLGEGAYVVFGEDHQQRLRRHIGEPARRLELGETLQ